MEPTNSQGAFWKTRPIDVGPNNTFHLVQETHGFQQPVLPPSLEWDAFDPTESPDKRAELGTFLQENYFSNKTPFQICYSPTHLEFELTNPDGSFAVLLRHRIHKQVVACIAGDVRHYLLTEPSIDPDKLRNVLNIKFFCIHPSLRNLRLAPKLITEISRIAHETRGIQKAYYNSVKQLAPSFCESTNYHYPLHVLRCVERDYAYPPKEELKYLLRRSPTPCVRFERLTPGHPEDLKERCRRVILYEYAATKTIYEDISVAFFKKALEASSVCWVFVVLDCSTQEFLGCIWTFSHPYKILDKLPPLNTMLTVLMYHYGFVPELKKSFRKKIWDAFLVFARDEHAELQWDSLTVTQEEIFANFRGFRKGHCFYHYFYNVRVVPLEPHQITMIGV